MAPSQSLAHNALQDLVLFVEVARRRCFSRGAQALGLSAATLSRRIARLEAEAGVRLFNRTTRRVELTGHGSRSVGMFAAQACTLVKGVKQALVQQGCGFMPALLQAMGEYDLVAFWWLLWTGACLWATARAT